SYTGLGVLGEGYWNGGWLGVVGVGMVLGFLFSIIGPFSLRVLESRQFIFLPIVFGGILMGLRIDDWFVRPTSACRSNFCSYSLGFAMSSGPPSWEVSSREDKPLTSRRPPPPGRPDHPPRGSRMNPQTRKIWIVLFAVLSGGGLLGILHAGEWLSATQDVPAPGDVIVALGGGGLERVDQALRLYHNGYARRILLTGIRHEAAGPVDPAAQWQSKYLFERGVPVTALMYDEVSKNTYEEAANTARYMKIQGWKTALVVSDPPHLRRLAMVWGPACAQHGLEYRLVATEPSTWHATGWWRDKVWAKFVGMELLKLSYYAIVY
ncbi:MAG: YdcF family protein, partial [Nitrospirae bacterium]|nr:YdcF family protein [Nitrospirota bacterium]